MGLTVTLARMASKTSYLGPVIVLRSLQNFDLASVAACILALTRTMTQLTSAY